MGGGTIAVALAIEFQDSIPYAIAVIPAMVLLLFVPVLLAFLSWVSLGFGDGRRRPRKLALTEDGWRLSFDTGPDASFRWADETVLFRIIDREGGRFPFPREMRFVISVSPSGAPNGDDILGELLPRSAVEPMIAHAQAHGLSVYRERFQVTVGRVTRTVGEIQLRVGPPIDTQKWGLFESRRRQEPA